MVLSLSDPAVESVAKAAIQAAVDEVSPQQEIAELLGDLGLPQTAKVVEVREAQARRGPGRPRGARNRRAESSAQLVQRMWGDPVMRAASLAMMSIEELAAALGCTPFEAAQEQRLWMALVLPYIAQRQPLAVDVRNTRVVHLSIGMTQDASDPTSTTASYEIVGYQDVSDVVPMPVAQREVAQPAQGVDNAG